MPLFRTTVDHTGALGDLAVSPDPLPEVQAPVPTEAGVTVYRYAHAATADAARALIAAQLETEREAGAPRRAPGRRHAPTEGASHAPEN